MVKKIRTLLTLFLLLMGTTMSWAAFKDFEIDLTQETPTLPEGVVATNDGAHGPRYNGGHGWANYVFKFTASESVKITLQKCYYGANACVKVGDPKNGEVLTTLDTKQTETNCNGEVSWIYTYDGTAKDLYVLCGDYCHKAKVERVVVANDFGINLVTKDAPSLPEGVKQISYPQNGVNYRNGDSHGTSWYAIEFNVDGPVDITLGGCQHINAGYEAYLTDASGNKIADINNKTAKCFDADGSCGTYKYKGGAQTLRLYCGQYCPNVKVSKPFVFKDFSLDFTKTWAAENISVGGSASSLYVTASDNGVPTLTTTAPANYIAHIFGYYKNSTYGLYYNAKVKVPVLAGKYKIDLGMSDCGGKIAISDGTTVLTTIDSKGNKFSADPANIASGEVTVKSDCVLEIYASEDATKVYFPYIKVSQLEAAGEPSTSDFEDFKIDFQANPYKVTLPSSGVLPSNVTVDAATYNGAQHGVENPTITVGVTGPVKFTIGSCQYGAHTIIVTDENKNTVATIDNNNGCDASNGKTKFVEWIYNEEKAATLTFAVSGYLPFFNAEACEYIAPVTVTYYNTNGAKIGEETIPGTSALKYKYNASNVTIPAGHVFRGWYDGTSASAKKVVEGISVTENISLYAKTSELEVATTTSTHNYDLTQSAWDPELHDLIDIENGSYYNDHGWNINGNGTIKLKVAGDAIITVIRCEYGSGTTVTATDGNNKEIAKFDAKAAKGKDKEPISFMYKGAATTLTLTFASQTFVHAVSVEHIVPVAFEPFKIDFRSDPYTVTAPESGKLPACATISDGTWHDGQHGYSNAAITVKVDRPVKFTIGTCNYTDKATVSVDGGAAVELATKTEKCDNPNVGSTYDYYVTYKYEGTEPAVLKFNLGKYCPYFFAEEWSGVKYDEATKTYTVAAGNVNQLLDAIKDANSTGDRTIYLPNGTYNLGNTINTTIAGNNIAIIGESRDGVIIKNTPAEEGLGKSATLKNMSTGLYLQDITISCEAPYNTAEKAERGVALWDRGTMTICKNVYLKGKQDTYYSNGNEGMVAYFEGGKIEGTVDFICGSGNVLFNSVSLNVTTSANHTSGGVIAAPGSYKSENGYVFVNCKITADAGQKGTYHLARGWKESPAALFVNTILVANPLSTGWGQNINTLESRRFAAYRTVPVGSFTDKIINDANTVSVDKASLVEFIGNYDWTPVEIISAHNPIKTNNAGWASYTAYTDVWVDGAKAYVATKINEKSVTLTSVDEVPAGTGVFILGEPNTEYNVELPLGATPVSVNKIKPVIYDTPLTASSNAFVLGTKSGVSGLYKVNSNMTVPAGKAYLDATGATLALAKDMLEFVFEDEATGIKDVNVNENKNAVRYNLAGQKVGKNYKGIVVRDGKKALVK